jgi:hypothetical protein
MRSNERRRVRLALSGKWAINVNANSSDPYDSGSGNVGFYTLAINGTGVPTAPYNGYYAYTDIAAGNVSTNNPPPLSIPLNFTVTSGSYIPIYYSMMISGSEEIGANSSASYDLNLSHSLVWNGIDSVTDDATGETVTDWSITSESGVDYSKPVSDVPEPSRLAIAGLGAVAWLLAARQRGER